MVVVDMLRHGVPWPIVLLILLLRWTGNVHHSRIDFAEYFAGVGEQTRALQQSGLAGHAHDLVHGLEPRFAVLMERSCCHVVQ